MLHQVLGWGEPRQEEARQKLPSSGDCHNHRVAEGGRDLWGSPGPSPRSGRASQSRSHRQPLGISGDGDSTTSLGSLHNRLVLPNAQREPPGPQFVPAAFHPVPGHPGNEPGSVPTPRIPGPFCSKGTLPTHAPRHPQGPQTPFLPRSSPPSPPITC